MTTEQATKICALHSIETKIEDGTLYLRDDYMLNGAPEHKWTPCPATYRDLMFWLGY